MHTREKISENQLAVSACVLLLSPALRLFPTASASVAGSAAPLTALLSFFPAAAYLYLTLRTLSLRREGEGLCPLILRAAPGRAGRAVLWLLLAWLTVYTAFILRSGADRFIVAVFPNTPPSFFVVTMAAAGLAAVYSPLCVAARSAKLFAPVLTGTLIIVLGAALLSVRAENLLPVDISDAPRVLTGTVPALDVLSWTAFASLFLLPETERGVLSFRRLLPYLGGMCVFLALMSADIVGCFGAPLTAELSWPFFTLVRSLVFFRSIERVEALLVALWIFPDFMIVSLFLRAQGQCLGALFPRRLSSDAARRVLPPLLAAAAAGAALLLAPDADRLFLLSSRVIPAANLFFTFILLPAVLAAGRLKKRL